MKQHYYLFFSGILCLFVSGLKSQDITFTNCSELPICFPFNNCTAVEATVTAEATTNCSTPTVSFSYKVDLFNDGSLEVQNFGSSVTQVFPPGQSRIIWRATNNCGQVSTCNQIINVRDCQAPNMICRNGITQSLDNDCTITVSAQHFILSISDNCTPTTQLKYGLRKAGTGTGFPPFDTITYHICDQGVNIVEVWVKDGNGNINQCSNYVIVQNNSNICPCIQSTDVTLKGCARTFTNTKLATYRINAKALGTTGVDPVQMQKSQTFTDSCYTMGLNGLPLNFTGQLQVNATREDLLTNGVTPYDLVLISRHILNLEPMTSIYQILAADVNRSKTITSFDIVEIRKALLGSVDSFPAVPTWQFVRPVSNPSNLIGFTAVKDSFLIQMDSVSGPVSYTGLDWIGIKSGDVDRTTAFTGSNSSDRNNNPMVFTAPDQWVNAGERFSMPVHSTESAELTAWQLALQPVDGAVRIETVNEISEDAWQLQTDGSIKILWMDEVLGASKSFAPGQKIAEIQAVAQQSGWLSQLLRLPQGEPVEAVTDAVVARQVQFHFTPANQTGFETEIFQPAPNPVMDGITWPLLLATDGTIRVQVFDASGRVVRDEHYEANAGAQTVQTQLADQAPGWYSWRITAGQTVATGKLIKK